MAIEHLKLEFHDPVHDAETHQLRTWKGVSAEHSRLRLPVEYDFKWEGGNHYLAYHDLVLLDGELTLADGFTAPGGDLRGKMTYVPIGCSLEGWAKPVDRMNSFTIVQFDPKAMEEELQSEFNGVESEPLIYFEDGTLGNTLRKLGRVLGEGSQSGSSVYAEMISLTAALEIFSLHRRNMLKIKNSGTLSNMQRKLVQDFIEANFARDITLDDLASVCNLSRFHFTRAFKATFGQPPHSYLNAYRLEFARRVLATTDHSVSEAAQLCGFNGLSQFTRAFRAMFKQSPLEYRRGC